MGSSTFAARFLVAVLLLSGIVETFASPAQARLPPVPGSRCLNSFPLQSNLPFTDDSRASEIVDIDGFMTPLSGYIVGFIYTTRRGEHFIQVVGSNFDGASAALGNVGATRLANAVKFSHSAGAVFRIDEPESVGILGKLMRHDELYRCFIKPLP